MIQIIEENRKPSTSEKFGQAITGGINAIAQYGQLKKEIEASQERQKQISEAGKKLLGMDISQFDPDTQKALLVEGLKQQGKTSQQKSLMDFVNKLEDEREPVLEKNVPEISEEDKIIEQKKPSKSNKYSEKAIIAASASPGGAAIAREMRAHNDAVDKKEMAQTKLEQEERRRLQAETAPLKQEIIEKANLARESIANKTTLMNLIDRGNLDDPTFAVFAMSLPFNLGKRLLSDDTVEYKGGLVDEFRDLKNIFKGATRVKEVEIYEDKLADIYLTDSQKKAILKSRVNTAKIDLLREEAALEVEQKYPNLSALQFNKKVDELMKPKLDALFNTIWDQQKSIIDDAENKKKIPLDPTDPEDKKIMQQIFKEAGGDKTKAKQLAKKKGYSVVGVP